jgi:hypothetical protein
LVTRALVGALAAGAVLIAGAAAIDGCGDDRAHTASLIYYCDPTSPTADHDCGDNYACYSATQSLGHAFCVPTCAHADATTCDGVCTVAGECLKRCTVPDDPMKDPCQPPLSCVRRTVSPIEAAQGNDGVCLAVNQVCSTDEQCTSSVFNACSGSITAGHDISGSVCADFGCAANGSACEPGSSCLKKVLPAGVQTADVCTPDCVPRRDASMKPVFECPPGFMCLSTAFPAENLHICAPGSAGWLCADGLDCVAGGCKSWSDVAPELTPLTTCSPPCTKDDDCTMYDRLGNPSFVTKLTCRANVCRALVSMIYPEQCFTVMQPCTRLDPLSTCTPPALAGASPDGGAVGPGEGPTCTRECVKNDDCAALAVGTHVPQLCDRSGHCAPAAPFIANCVPGGASGCLGDLSCVPLAPTFAACTRTCAGDADCANDPMLGSTFTCPSGLCVPKIASGSPTPASQQCLSGRSVQSGPNNVCVSPTNWACDTSDQCESGVCDSGRCQ